MVKPIPLPLIAGPDKLVECTDCAKCCTYVAVPIAAPDRAKDATSILWMLYHERVTVYRDADGDWCVVFETRCRNLQADKLCGIYVDRPHVCRDFDNTICDVNDPEGGLDLRTPQEYLQWLKMEKPRIYRTISKGFVPALLSASPPAR